MSDHPSLPGFGSAPARDSLFFAILPDAPAAARLVEIAGDLHDANRLTEPPLPRVRLHVTLCSLGMYHGVPACRRAS